MSHIHHPHPLPIPPELDQAHIDFLLNTTDDSQWRHHVAITVVYLSHALAEIRRENERLRAHVNQLLEAAVSQDASVAQNPEAYLRFHSGRIPPRLVLDFDPLEPERTADLGLMVARLADSHGYNGCTLHQVVQPITSGVIKQVFEKNAAKYTFTEDSVGKGRPARYLRISPNFMNELCEVICDGFAASKEQRVHLIPSCRTIIGTVAKNFFNNARSHRSSRKKCEFDDDEGSLKTETLTPDSQSMDAPSTSFNDANADTDLENNAKAD